MNAWRCPVCDCREYHGPLPVIDSRGKTHLYVQCERCGGLQIPAPGTLPEQRIVHDCCECPWGDWQRDYAGSETGRCLELGITTVARGGGCTGSSRTP